MQRHILFSLEVPYKYTQITFDLMSRSACAQDVYILYLCINGTSLANVLSSDDGDVLFLLDSFFEYPKLV